MPKVNDVYGSKYLKAEDIKDKGNVNATIEEISIMDDKDDEGNKTGKKKLVLHFRGSEKLLPLNVTNASMAVELFGSDDTDHWVGQRVCLYTCMVMFGTKKVLAIRLKAPAAPRPAAAARPTPPPPPPPVEIGLDSDDDLDGPLPTTLTDDDIPFMWLLPFVLPLTAALAFLSV